MLITCCDGLSGLPDAIRTVWPDTTVQTCVVHMVRNSLRYASKKHWSAITKQMRPIYTAPTVAAAEAAFDEFADNVARHLSGDDRVVGEILGRVRAVPGVPARAAQDRVHDQQRSSRSTSRFRRAIRQRGHFPTEQAAMKVLYLVATEQRKNRTNMTGRINGWKTILNALTVHYGERITNHL